MTPPARVRRILILEDHKNSAERIQEKLESLDLGPDIQIEVTVLLGEHGSDIRNALKQWYPHGRSSSPKFEFDFTSLDIIFQSTDEGDEADGGVRIYEWLDTQVFAEHLGQLVVRTYSDTKYFHGKSFNGLPVLKVDKNNQHELGQWEDILRG